MMTEMKPLKPLDSGIVLIVGGKPSNFDHELRNHPRIVMWDSQHEHWTNKDMPSNTRVVFMTRFIGHSAFEKIVAEARKRNITIFNPTGTGVVVRQVKELLNLNKVKETGVLTAKLGDIKIVEAKKPIKATTERGKLTPLVQLIDFSKSNKENAEILMLKAKEMGIETTIQSLNQIVVTKRKKLAPDTRVRLVSSVQPVQPKTEVRTEAKAEVDVTVEILDGLIKGMMDIRQYLVDTVEENRILRDRVAKFKTALEGI